MKNICDFLKYDIETKAPRSFWRCSFGYNCSFRSTYNRSVCLKVSLYQQVGMLKKEEVRELKKELEWKIN